MRLALLIVLSGCATTQTPAFPAQAATDAVSLGVGDVFEVRVYQEPDLSGAYRVGSDGSVNFPLLGRVKVQGKSSADLADVLTTRLKDGYIKNPQINIAIKEYNSKKVYVLGQVARPGAYPFSDDMSIVNAIASAGGFTRQAAPNRTNVTRVIAGSETHTTVRVDDIGKGQEKNVSLAPGDIIFVPESIF
jgi:protein involved in polysaccharide export with SLBB domain